jgi:hypothetical protein
LRRAGDRLLLVATRRDPSKHDWLQQPAIFASAEHRLRRSVSRPFLGLRTFG